MFFMLPPLAMGVPRAYGYYMDGIDRGCNGYPWCTIKTLNIQNNFGFLFKHSSCVSHLQCLNEFCDYMYHNGGICNNNKLTGSISIPFYVENEALKNDQFRVWYANQLLCALHFVMLVYP